MPTVRFQETTSFNENWETFMAEMDQFDAEMAAILRTNTDRLAAIVHQSQRYAQERAQFNETVAEALDRLITPPPEEQQN